MKVNPGCGNLKCVGYVNMNQYEQKAWFRAREKKRVPFRREATKTVLSVHPNRVVINLLANFFPRPATFSGVVR